MLCKIPSCECDVDKRRQDHTNNQKLMQYLMGLDDTYQQLRSNILTTDPLPSVKIAFSLILREESHRVVKEKKVISESSAFLTNMNNNRQRGSSSKLKCKKCNRIGHTIDKCFELIGFSPRNNNMKCTKCGLTYHTVDRCFEIVGYPPNFKRRNISSSNTAKYTSSSSDARTSVPNSVNLSSDQVSKLLSILDGKVHNSNIESNLLGEFLNLNAYFNNHFHKFFMVNQVESQNNNSFGWIIDSGANQHMTNSDKNFEDVVDVSNLNLTVGHPNGTRALVSKIGNLRFSEHIVLHDVLIMPQYCVSLLSVHCLVRDNDLFVGFDKNKCYIQDLKSLRTLETGNQCDGLYLFDGRLKGNPANNIDGTCYLSKTIWHHRLGHPADQVLHVLKTELKLDNFQKHDPCEGPYRVVSKGGYRYFLTVVYDCTRVVWVYLLKSKEQHYQDSTLPATPNVDTGHPEGNTYNQTIIPTQDTAEDVRRSTRKTQLPSKYNEFVLNIKFKYGLDKEASKDPKWVDAMNAEMEALHINGTWILTDLPEGRKPIRCKWDVYMSLPLGYYDQSKKKVCKLVKSLYRLKQAPRKWNEKLTAALVEFGFQQSKNDYSLFVKSNNTCYIGLLMYVDDIVVTGSDIEEVNKVKTFLATKFMIKDLGVLKYFLGIEILNEKNGLFMCQRK
ncbi:uncharacterized protein [Rutidosis leptorrhynchoides]|uniref:uncharacterized protein n=1 Tax=Rutidosis leptorrhynchoides TaxID=125765 RepID=UPI003A9A5FC5